METTASIRDLVQRYGKLVKPHEIKLNEYPSIVKRGILLATAKKEDQTVLLCLPDSVTFAEVLDLWKCNFYAELVIWFVPNEGRAGLACEFIKFFGREEEILKNPLRFKGLDWNGENYWVAIANDPEPSAQGELFPAEQPEVIPLNIGDNKIFLVLRKAVTQGRLKKLTFYKLKKIQGNQFRLIYPWWIQRSLMQVLKEKSASAPTSEQLELESVG